MVDVGYTSCKAGFAGEDNPKAVFPSVSFHPHAFIIATIHVLRQLRKSSEHMHLLLYKPLPPKKEHLSEIYDSYAASTIYMIDARSIKRFFNPATELLLLSVSESYNAYMC